MQSSFVRVTVAVFVPASSGANVTVKVVEPDAAMTAGKDMPPRLNNAELVSDIAIPLTVNELVELEFCSVYVFTNEPFTSTAPKSVESAVEGVISPDAIVTLLPCTLIVPDGSAGVDS